MFITRKSEWVGICKDDLISFIFYLKRLFVLTRTIFCINTCNKNRGSDAIGSRNIADITREIMHVVCLKGHTK